MSEEQNKRSLVERYANWLLGKTDLAVPGNEETAQIEQFLGADEMPPAIADKAMLFGVERMVLNKIARIPLIKALQKQIREKLKGSPETMDEMLRWTESHPRSAALFQFRGGRVGTLSGPASSFNLPNPNLTYGRLEHTVNRREGQDWLTKSLNPRRGGPSIEELPTYITAYDPKTGAFTTRPNPMIKTHSDRGGTPGLTFDPQIDQLDRTDFNPLFGVNIQPAQIGEEILPPKRPRPQLDEATGELIPIKMRSPDVALEEVARIPTEVIDINTAQPITLINESVPGYRGSLAAGDVDPKDIPLLSAPGGTVRHETAHFAQNIPASPRASGRKLRSTQPEAESNLQNLEWEIAADIASHNGWLRRHHPQLNPSERMLSATMRAMTIRLSPYLDEVADNVPVRIGRTQRWTVGQIKDYIKNQNVPTAGLDISGVSSRIRPGFKIPQ